MSIWDRWGGKEQKPQEKKNESEPNSGKTYREEIVCALGGMCYSKDCINGNYCVAAEGQSLIVNEPKRKPIT